MAETKQHSKSAAHQNPNIAKHDILDPERHSHPVINHDKLNSDLLMAAKAGKKEELEPLLKAGADLNKARDNHGWTALAIAAFHGNFEACEFLIQKGADLNARDNAKATPLHWAAFNGQIQACLLLVEKGADLNAKDAHEETPYQFAIIQGHIHTAQCLINMSNAKPKDSASVL